MATKPQHPVRNGIIATVVGGLILSLIPQLRDFFVQAMLWAWRIVTWIWAALIANYSAPGWVFLILGLFTLAGLALLCTILWSQAVPAHRNYTEDMLYGAKWSWSWDGDELSNLWCFCPCCDAQLVHGYSQNFGQPTKTDFICEHCSPLESDFYRESHGRVVVTKPGDRDYVVSAAKREILRRIRTGEFSSNS